MIMMGGRRSCVELIKTTSLSVAHVPSISGLTLHILIIINNIWLNVSGVLPQTSQCQQLRFKCVLVVRDRLSAADGRLGNYTGES